MQWPRVKAVFLAALELRDGERREFLERACADAAGVRAEVESLLSCGEAAIDLCETPAAALLGPLPPTTQPPPRRLSPGTCLGPYEITGFLSAGGMGEVYRARHRVLGREVAIKTVNAETAGPEGYRRLLREARHASVLDHPNVCTIHEVGEWEGTPFIAMALVAGRPLSEIVRSCGPSIAEALGYGIQVASALETAHRHGVVHRDLKSSNVVVDADGRAVVLDFGVARRLPGAADLRSAETTEPDRALAGTLSHMAPQVLLGEEADPRSDIWSLGVLLYELVTGSLPFQGRTPFEVSSAILTEPPRPISGRVPLGLRLVIERCLRKDPEARYQSAAQVREALEAVRRHRALPVVGHLLVSARHRVLAASAVLALGSVAALSAGPRLWNEFGGLRDDGATALALLPLENATGDPDLEFYAAGLTDGLTRQLGAAAEIRLISRASATRATRDGLTPAEVARSLGADALVTGRLRAASGRIALELHLLDSASGRVLWSETFERAPQHVLALQRDVVRAIAREVRLGRRAGSVQRPSVVGAVDPEAYGAYLRGRFHLDQWTPTGTQLAREYFQRAIELAPNDPLAYVGLAETYVFHESGMPPTQAMPLARELATRALGLDPTRGEVYALLAQIAFLYEWDWIGAEEKFGRALALNPGYAEAHHMYSHLLLTLGRFEESLEASLRAVEIDPLSPAMNVHLGAHYWIVGELDLAIERFQKVLRSDPSYSEAHWHLAIAYWNRGMREEAIAALQTALALQRRPKIVAYLAAYQARLGRTREAGALLEELTIASRQRYVPASFFALVYDGLGQVEPAIAWLEKAYEERDWFLHTLELPGSGPELARGDPRFQRLRGRLNLPVHGPR